MTEAYDYNIQGWLTSQSSELFDMQLKYYDPDLPASSGILPSYTGNITQWNWRHKDGDHTGNGYGFKYDGLSRLTDSRLHDKSGDAWAANNNFRETIGSPAVSPYDLNGNINYLKRTGPDGPVEDEFQYSYAGNQLTSLETPEGVVEYSYDANGNIDYDGRKDLFFQYNYLNLLSTIFEKVSAEPRQPDPDFPGCIMPPVPRKDTIATYTWLADGTKLQVADSTGRGYVYLGSLVYKLDNGELEFESTAFGGGRIQKATAGLDANYQITDHLGSVRVVFGYDEEGDARTIARNDYYAFGKKHLNADLQTATGDINSWLYNGKELQTTGNLGFLDYGARMYDNITGRWFTIDPQAEKNNHKTPYNFCSNNPVCNVDIGGRDDYFSIKGAFLYRDTQKSDNVMIVTPNPEAQGYVESIVTGESTKITETVLSNKAIVSIVSHYNEQLDRTDGELEGLKIKAVAYKDNSAVMAAVQSENTIHVNKSSSYNSRGGIVNELLDTASNIKNTLVHERTHITDTENKERKDREQAAIDAQRSHETWENTTEKYKKKTKQYESTLEIP